MTSAPHLPLLPLPAHAGGVLTLRDVALRVRLGVPAEERAFPQPVSVHIDIYFPQPPACAASDSIEDTYCYDGIAAALEQVCRDNAFRLIETLCGALAKALSARCPGHIGFTLQAVKTSPPVAALRGGAAFTLYVPPA